MTVNLSHEEWDQRMKALKADSKDAATRWYLDIKYFRSVADALNHPPPYIAGESTPALGLEQTLDEVRRVMLAGAVSVEIKQWAPATDVVGAPV